MKKIISFFKRIFLVGFPYLIELLKFKELTKEEILKLEEIVREQKFKLKNKEEREKEKVS